MDEWTDMGNDTFRRDYTNYVYGIIAKEAGGLKAGLYNCAGFECKTLAMHRFATMDEATAFLDAEAEKQ